MSDMFGDDDNDIEFALKKNRIKRERGLIDDCRSINQQLEAATVGKILVLEHEIETLTAERNALKQQRDDLLAALEKACGKSYRGTLWLDMEEVDALKATIASVKEKK